MLKSSPITDNFLTEERLLKWGLVLAIAFLLLINFSRILYPYDTGIYEGCIWAPANVISQGTNVYTMSFTTNPPYVMSPYGVFYYALIGMGLKLFGFQFWVGRLLSLLCAILSTLCICKLTLHFTRDKALTRLSALLFLAQIPLQLWIGVQRPDLIALTLSLAGITISLTAHLQAGKNKKILLTALSALLLTLAILTRQTVILPVLVVSWWYFRNHAYRSLFLFLCLTAIFLFPIMAWLNYTSDGGYLMQQFLIQTGGEKNIHLTFTLLQVFIQSTSLFIFLLWVIAIGSKENTNSVSPKSAFENNSALYRTTLLLYGIFSFMLALVSSIHPGASINYYLEVTVVLSLIVPLYWSRVQKTLRLTKYYRLCLAVIILSLSFWGIRICKGEYDRWKALPYYNEIISVIKQKTPVNQPVYSEYPELAVLAGRPCYFNDFCQYNGRAPVQHQIVENNLHTGVFSAIIISDSNVMNGYYRFPISEPIPYKFYVVYLYLKK